MERRYELYFGVVKIIFYERAHVLSTRVESKKCINVLSSEHTFSDDVIISLAAALKFCVLCLYMCFH